MAMLKSINEATPALGFGMTRDVLNKVKSENIAEITDEKKIENLKGSTWLQSGTNK